eukprot:scaffold2067_cov238-Pinguiococcus_pyrenoidosus.AAC.2
MLRSSSAGHRSAGRRQSPWPPPAPWPGPGAVPPSALCVDSRPGSFSLGHRSPDALQTSMPA